MKSNPLMVALVAVFAVCAIATVILSATFTLKLRKLGPMQAAVQARLVQINNVNNFLRSLSADSLEYSKKNPAINPILQTFGIINPEPKPGVNPVTSASKPGGK